MKIIPQTERRSPTLPSPCLQILYRQCSLNKTAFLLCSLARQCGLLSGSETLVRRHYVLKTLAKRGGKALSTEEVRLLALTFPKSLRFASGN